MSSPQTDGRLIAQGRDADVFDLGDNTVLRRYRTRDVPGQEVDVMRYARASHYPVPEVVSWAGRDLVLERIGGPTLQEWLLEDPSRISDGAAMLAALHRRLGEIAGPEWLPRHGEGDRLLHLDLHPANVLLSRDGPVVIDWANAARGPAALDPAMAIAVLVSATATVPTAVRAYLERFITAFAANFDDGGLGAVMPLAVAMRSRDPNVTTEERAALQRLAG